MRRKALDQDSIKYLAMSVAAKLGKSLDDIKDWSLDDMYDWVAFFRIEAREEAAAIKRARSRNTKGPSDNVIID